MNLQRVFTVFILLFAFAYCGKGNIDIANAKRLQAEKVDDLPDKEGPVHDLFGKSPGFSAKLSSLGAVDSVGTALNTDFDGDGITNEKECEPDPQHCTSNFWVSDYPVIDSEIAPPVTMEIEIQQIGTGQVDSISSDINSDDFESRKNEGTEEFHQNELALRTIKIGEELSETNNSSSQSSSKKVEAEVGGTLPMLPISAQISGTLASENTSTNTQKNSVKTDTYGDQEFKNNIDRNATRVNSDNAAAKARKYRKEKRAKEAEQYTTSANAGYVRAALFIKNYSTNMPVRISNILCSLLFEASDGRLIPVQSFRLRNDDFSLFDIDVYGGSEFGPYVVELTGLNTVEIENAINRGYTPKVYIIDYDMHHVENSNYKTALSDKFDGDNLKIIEENAKGRTALFKIIGPDRRDLARVAAFDIDLNSPDTDPCSLNDVNFNGNVRPGVSLEKAMHRLGCSGDRFEFRYYVFDVTGSTIEANRPALLDEIGPGNQFAWRGIYKIDNVASNFPCDENIDQGIVGGEATDEICYIRLADLEADPALFNNAAIWSIYSDARYYKTFRQVGQGLDVVGCDSPGSPPCAIPLMSSADQLIWPGDYYDIVYAKVSEIFRAPELGDNPLETGAEIAFNTKWDLQTIGEHPFYPDTNSVFLGRVGLGDQVEIKIKLDSTVALNPNFTLASSNPNVYEHFTYNQGPVSQLFTIEEAVDFEVNLGLGGTEAHWMNIVRDAQSSPNAGEIGNCGRSWSFNGQEFTLCIQLPLTIDGVSDDGLLDLYLRPSLSNAYRNSIWPQDYTQVKKFDSQIFSNAALGATSITVDNAIGALGDGDVVHVGEDTTAYTVSNALEVGPATYRWSFDIAPALAQAATKGTRVSVAGSGQPNMYMQVDNDFFIDWNSENPLSKLLISSPDCTNPAFISEYGSVPACYGVATDTIANNWIGSGFFNNNWADGGGYRGFLEGDIFNFLHTENKSVRMIVPNDELHLGEFPLGSSVVTAINDEKVILIKTTDLGNNQFHIVGQLFDIESASFESEFFIATAPGVTERAFRVSVACDNEQAIVVWASHDNPQLNGVVIDLSDLSLSSNIPISTSSSIGNQALDVYLENKIALIVWDQTTGDYSTDLRGRFIDISNIGSGNDFLIPSSNGGSQGQAKVAIQDNKALIVWIDRPSNSRANLRGRILSMGDESSGYEFNIEIGPGSHSLEQVHEPRIALKNNLALVSWGRLQSNGGGPYIIRARGRVIPLGAPTSREVFDIAVLDSPDTFSIVYNSAAFISDHKVIVAWAEREPRYRVNARIINLITMDMMASFALPGAEYYSTILPTLKTVDGKVLATWVASNIDGTGAIYGRYIDEIGPVGGDFNIIKDPTFGANIVNNNEYFFLSWTRLLGVDFYDGFSFHSKLLPANQLFRPQYGLNNFFTAPLIERDYTVTSRIKF